MGRRGIKEKIILPLEALLKTIAVGEIRLSTYYSRTSGDL